MAAIASKQRTLSYRRAEWFSAAPASTLQDLVAGALGTKATVASTKHVRADDSTVKVMHRRAKAGRPVFLHLSAHTPGEAASTLPVHDSVAECDLDVSAPPKGSEFLDGDAMIFISGNDVVLCVSNMHESSVGHYLRYLVSGSSHGKAAAEFDLLKIANKNVVYSLMSAGVKKVSLDVHAFQQSIKPMKAKNAGIIAAAKEGAVRLFGALVYQDQNATDFKAQADLQAAVTLRADRRKNGGGDIVAGAVAHKIVDVFDTGYEIETNSGIKITPEEISLRKKFPFPAHGKTVDYKAVWSREADFYNSLVADGLNV